MKFSKTTEYALQILIQMANDETRRVSSQDLHDALKIPKKYLQQLLTQLGKKGLIAGNKGRNGGFLLARTPADISIAEVVDAVEGLSQQYTCVFGFGNCARQAPCPVHDSWVAAQSQIMGILTSTKLSDIIVR